MRGQPVPHEQPPHVVVAPLHRQLLRCARARCVPWSITQAPCAARRCKAMGTRGTGRHPLKTLKRVRRGRGDGEHCVRRWGCSRHVRCAPVLCAQTWGARCWHCFSLGTGQRFKIQCLHNTLSGWRAVVARRCSPAGRTCRRHWVAAGHSRWRGAKPRSPRGRARWPGARQHTCEGQNSGGRESRAPDAHPMHGVRCVCCKHVQ